MTSPAAWRVAKDSTSARRGIPSAVFSQSLQQLIVAPGIFKKLSEFAASAVLPTGPRIKEQDWAETPNFVSLLDWSSKIAYVALQIWARLHKFNIKHLPLVIFLGSILELVSAFCKWMEGEGVHFATCQYTRTLRSFKWATSKLLFYLAVR